jgi:hypothetical protein
MTKPSFTLLGDQYGMHSNREDELQGFKYTKEWLETCSKSCPGCAGQQSSSKRGVCHHANLNANYPLALPAAIRGQPMGSLTQPTEVSGAAILQLNDAGRLQPKWPYAWKQQIFRTSQTRGAFWNSNTAVGPYIQCGVCKTTTCFSNADGGKFRYFSKHGKLCSKAEALPQGSDKEHDTDQSGPDGVVAPLKAKADVGCTVQPETSRYCTSQSRAECVYIQYCEREDWNCDSNSGWSDPIYDCTKLISNTGITGDEWCAQHVLH